MTPDEKAAYDAAKKKELIKLAKEKGKQDAKKGGIIDQGLDLLKKVLG